MTLMIIYHYVDDSICGGVDETEKDGPSERELFVQQIPDTRSIVVIATAPCSCVADPHFANGQTKGI